MTAEELIGNYVKLRDHVHEQTRRFDDYVRGYREQMEEIENKLNEIMNSQGAENIRTPAGTAYKSTIMSTKITDRATFLEYVIHEIESEGDSAMLICSPKKDAVQQYLDQNHANPPGVAVEFLTRVNIRRS